jgi:hypothetical protein
VPSLLLGVMSILVMAAIAVRPAWFGAQLVLGVCPLVRAGSGWRGTSGDRRGDRRNGTTVYGRWDLGASARPPRMGTATRARLTLGILPVFAVANAGVSLRRFNFSAAGALTVFVAVVVARVLGKPLGSR